MLSSTDALRYARVADELKHGPLALIDEEILVVVAPNNELLDKLKSNIQVVRARGGQLFVIADVATGVADEPGTTVIRMPHADTCIAPIVYTVPLQLLAYYVAVLKGSFLQGWTQTPNCQVIRFSCPGSEENLILARAAQVGDLLTSFIDGMFCL
jgi:hypothetical protein